MTFWKAQPPIAIVASPLMRMFPWSPRSVANVTTFGFVSAMTSMTSSSCSWVMRAGSGCPSDLAHSHVFATGSSTIVRCPAHLGSEKPVYLAGMSSGLHVAGS
jgi:hypothetical protein